MFLFIPKARFFHGFSPILYYRMGRHDFSYVDVDVAGAHLMLFILYYRTFPKKKFNKFSMLMLEEHMFISPEWPPPDFCSNWPKRVSLFRILGVMRSSHHHSWPCSWEVWWERHPRKMEVCVFTDIWKDHVWKTSGICFAYSTSSVSRFIWEKNPFPVLSTFVKELYLTTVGRWFLRHLERITKSLTSSKLP